MKSFLILITFYAFSVSSVFACTCGSRGGLGDETKVMFDQASVVFTGTVIEINEKTVKIKPEKFYKGEQRDEILFERSPCSCTCDVGFTLKRKFLVFGTASGTGKTSLFVTDVCAGTARVEDSKKEINYLEHPPQDEIQPGLIDPDLYKPKKDLPKSKAKKTKRPL